MFSGVIKIYIAMLLFVYHCTFIVFFKNIEMGETVNTYIKMVDNK